MELEPDPKDGLYAFATPESHDEAGLMFNALKLRNKPALEPPLEELASVSRQTEDFPRLNFKKQNLRQMGNVLVKWERYNRTATESEVELAHKMAAELQEFLFPER